MDNRWLTGDEIKPELLPFTDPDWRGAAYPKQWETWEALANQEQKSSRYSKQTGKYTWSTLKYYDEDDPLLESGLIGLVRLFMSIQRSV